MGDESVRVDGYYFASFPGQNVEIKFYEEISKCPKWWWEFQCGHAVFFQGGDAGAVQAMAAEWGPDWAARFSSTEPDTITISADEDSACI